MPSLTVGATSVEVSGPLVIGREGDGLRLDDPGVSRRHALIEPDGDGVRLTDLGSRNGTFVNGAPVHGATPLRGGDRIVVGNTLLVVDGAAAAPQPPPPSPALETAPAAPDPLRLRAPASRRPVPFLLTIGVIIAVAVLLVVYFLIRPAP
jgi:nitrite reductase (NADH) large subunit